MCKIKYGTRGNNILDLVLVYDKEFVSQLKQIAPIGKSDHNTLLIEIKSNYKVQEKRVVLFKYNNANYRELENRLNRVDWETKLKNESVEGVWNMLIKILTDFREYHIPKLIRNVNKELPWFTKGIRILMKKRNNLFKRYKKTGLYHFKSKYYAMRNLVTKRIRLAKSKYESKVIKRSKNNRKIFYSYIATKNRKTVCKRVGPIVKVGSNGKEKEIVSDDIEVASLLNEFFISVFNKKEITEACSISNDSSQHMGLEKFVITDGEVLEAISEFKVNKSPGVDMISSTYALKIKEMLAKP